MPKQKLLEIKNLTVATADRKRVILEDLSLNIQNSSITVLIGPNGSGKTTLARAIMGLPSIAIEKGKILFQNQDITHRPTYQRAKQGITLAFQNPAYFEDITTEAFLRVSRATLQVEEMKKYLKAVGLDPLKFLKRKLDHHLSGGERKRIELASVIAMRPKLVILDEPDSGLDIIFYREFLDILQNIKETTQSSILLITHREEPGLLADKAILLNQGKIVTQGDFRSVMRKYCHLVGRKKICHHDK